jgi:hypothetical protein
MPKKRHKRVVDVTGKVFGALTVLRFVGVRRQAMWLCRCECGKEVTVAGYHLRSGHTTSCGCTRNVTHGETGSPEYRTWAEIKQRCYNPKTRYFHLYGGRGIGMCVRWFDSFEEFLSDMGRKPSPKHSVDRINNDGDYEPANCRWATKMEQSHNSRKVRNLTYKGETMCQSAWARRLGISINALRNRLKRGWPPDKVFTPKRYRKHHST